MLVRFSFELARVARYLACLLVISPYPRILTNGCMILGILGPPVPLPASPYPCFRFVLSNSLVAWFIGRRSWFCNSSPYLLDQPSPSSIPLYSLFFANPVFLSIYYRMALRPSEICAIYASYEMCFSPPLMRISPSVIVGGCRNLHHLAGVRPQCSCLSSTSGQVTNPHSGLASNSW